MKIIVFYLIDIAISIPLFNYLKVK